MPEDIQPAEPISAPVATISETKEPVSAETEKAPEKTALDEYVDSVLATVQLLPITDTLSAAKKARFERLNERMIAATKKRAIAEFRERALLAKAESAKARAAASAESAAVRRRREHLCYTLGAYGLSTCIRLQAANVEYLLGLLASMDNCKKFRKLQSELLEFLPFLGQNEQFSTAKFQKPQKENQHG